MLISFTFTRTHNRIENKRNVQNVYRFSSQFTLDHTRTHTGLVWTTTATIENELQMHATKTTHQLCPTNEWRRRDRSDSIKIIDFNCLSSSNHWIDDNLLCRLGIVHWHRMANDYLKCWHCSALGAMAKCQKRRIDIMCECERDTRAVASGDADDTQWCLVWTEQNSYMMRRDHHIALCERALFPSVSCWMHSMYAVHSMRHTHTHQLCSHCAHAQQYDIHDNSSQLRTKWQSVSLTSI